MSEEMRKQFEAWASSPEFGLTQSYFAKDERGEYINMPTENYWLCWKASRAALEVELPPTITADDVDNEYFQSADDLSATSARMVNGAIVACGAFIKAAGVRVKE